MMDEELEEAIFILQGLESIKAGRTHDGKEVLDEIKDKYDLK